MRDKAEIETFLADCDKVRNYGMSNGPCPLHPEPRWRKGEHGWACSSRYKENGVCINEVSHEDDLHGQPCPGRNRWDRLIKLEGKDPCDGRFTIPIPEEDDDQRECCAECSYPSALWWVLGHEEHEGNMQQQLISVFKGKKDNEHD